jgi:hypothetical protein
MVSRKQCGRNRESASIEKYGVTFAELWSRVKADGESREYWDEEFAFVICVCFFKKCCVPVLDLTSPRLLPNR